MTDVRLTATNPDDSSVVPVACNAKGELKLEEPTLNSDDYVAKAGDTMTGNLHLSDKITLNSSDGSAKFPGNVSVGDRNYAAASGNGGTLIVGNSLTNSQSKSYGLVSCQLDGSHTAPSDVIGFDLQHGTKRNFKVLYDGSAEFAGDVVIGSRNKKWMIVESGGIAHLVEQTFTAAGVQPAKYPALRNIPEELDLVEQALSDVMEKLRMKPPVGWPVWDGSDED